jgi:predicted dehydrogenase
MKIGVIGCGNIFEGAYVPGAKHYGLTLAAVADIDLDRARAAAQKHEIPKACSVDELLADPEIGLVLNLTVPKVHADLDRLSLEAGKHVWAEKPLALSVDQARPVLDLARSTGLRVGSAPDTILGTGLQTCRRVIDDGRLGKVIGGVAFMACPGHESWHPSPEFYYEAGGGPLFDMGPYYLSALVSLIGPVRRVAGFTARARTERLITSEPKKGKVVPVEVDTHIAGALEFASGAVVNLLMSFDTRAHRLPCLQLYGTEASMNLPDPNGFKGPVEISAGGREWQDVPCEHEPGRRGAGAADLIAALRTGRPHRTSLELAAHVLDVMESVIVAGHTHRVVDVQSTCERPAAIPLGLAQGTFE